MFDPEIQRLLQQYTVPTQMAKGGPLRGPGTGTSDSIPAVIDQQEPAALSDGEFVITAVAVAAAGGGDTEAGFAFFGRFMNYLERMTPEQALEYTQIVTDLGEVLLTDSVGTGATQSNDEEDTREEE